MGAAVVRWVLAVLGGVLVALAVVFQVAGWARYGQGGTDTTLVLAFASTVAGLPVLLGAVLGPGRRWRRAGAAGAALLVTLPLGQLWFQALRDGFAVRPAWTATVDRPKSARAVAVWQDGETVVRAREDRIDAYRATDGVLLWSLPARPREVVCAVSATAVDGVVGVAYGRFEGPCEQLTAVDLRSGRELWRRTGAPTVSLALSGPVVVAAAEDRLTAFGLRDGKDAWSAPATEGCRNQTLAGSAVRILTAEFCPEGGERSAGRTWLRAFGPDGTAGWRTDLAAESRPENLALLAADPPTVQLKETDPRGVDAVLALGADGALRATIPTNVPDLDLVGLHWSTAFRLAPVRKLTVVGDLLVTAAARPGSTADDTVAVYSLADGGRRWTRRIEGNDVIAVSVTRESLLVLVRTSSIRYRTQTVLTLDRVTGRKLTEREIENVKLSSPGWIGVTDDRFLVVHEDGTDYYRPVVGLPRR